MKRSILVISNGKGEDSIAVTILEKLKLIAQEEDGEEINLITLPLLGEGLAYKDKRYFTAATWSSLPSNGFTSPFSLFKDLRRGLWENFRKQAWIVSRESANVDLIVTVGDVVPMLLAVMYGGRKKIVHIATAISSYIRHYTLPELWFFKKYIACVVCRDAYTCQELQKYGVNAFYAGNPMMDDPILEPSSVNLGLEKKRKKIVLVPSSRDDAYINILRMLSLLKSFPNKSDVQFVLTMAPSLSLDVLRNALTENSEWRLSDNRQRKKPIVAEILNRNTPTVIVVQGYFRDCLQGATLALGMTGTGNEQIAGLGIPLVLLRGRSAAASGRRMWHYKKLLGEAVSILYGSDQKKIKQLTQLLNNERQLGLMSKAGQERMGPAGGAYFIARKIWYYLYSA